MSRQVIQAVAEPAVPGCVWPVGTWLSKAFVPLRDREGEWDMRMTMIRRARRFLYVSTYFIEHDDYGIRFLEELATAARRGVTVFLGVDGLGQRLGNYARTVAERRGLDVLLKRAAADGVQLGVYRPAKVLQRKLGAGHHVKVQLSDEGALLLGSSNVSARSFDGWGEFSAVLDGAIVARVLRDLIKLFSLTGDVHRAHVEELEAHELPVGRSPHHFEYLFHDPNVISGVLHPLVVAENPITNRLIRAIDGACASVRLSSFHCKPTPTLADALVRAAQRGVRVELFHSHRAALPESELPWLSAAFDYGRFLRAGIRIFESRRGEHSKLFVVDAQWAAFGSYNAEHAAHERLAEMLVTSDDPRMVRVIDSVLRQVSETSNVIPVVREHHRDGLVARLGWLLWRPLRRWL